MKSVEHAKNRKPTTGIKTLDSLLAEATTETLAACLTCTTVAMENSELGGKLLDSLHRLTCEFSEDNPVMRWLAFYDGFKAAAASAEPNLRAA